MNPIYENKTNLSAVNLNLFETKAPAMNMSDTNTSAVRVICFSNKNESNNTSIRTMLPLLFVSLPQLMGKTRVPITG